MSSRTTDRHVIWSNMNLNLDDWRDDIQADYPGATEKAMTSLMYDINNDYLDDERCNLNIQLNQPIIVIADIGRWNGRFQGYKMIDSGNIRDCLYSDTDLTEWYVDMDGNFKADAIHHDGHNHYMYRVFKNGVSDEQIEELQDKIYSGTVTKEDIDRVTRPLGYDISNVYGFDLPKEKQSEGMER